MSDRKGDQALAHQPATREVITDSARLAAICAELKGAPYLTIDTEFVREKTYWAQLCLIQIGAANAAYAIDSLAPGLDLAPFFDLLSDPATIKVFHAARQDIEILWTMTGKIPAPIFDTQIAAMVCGYGDQIGYDPLVQRLLNISLDKSSRYTDWSVRPLSARQIDYALSDVIFLRPVYEALQDHLHRLGRQDWMEDEMAIITNPHTYQNDPEDAWKRLKTRPGKPRFMAAIYQLASWREQEAQRRNLPRGRILRDESLLDLAASLPTNSEGLARARGISRGTAEGSDGAAILQQLALAAALPFEAIPKLAERPQPQPGTGPIVELLKVLLKHIADQAGVAPRLIASSDDLERIAEDDAANVAPLQGWRLDLFGRQALALKQGRLALAIQPARPKGRKMQPARLTLIEQAIENTPETPSTVTE